MKINRYIAGPIDANNYLVWDEISKDAVLIDCSDYVEEIIQKIKEEQLNLKYILITHGHFDHVLGLNAMNSVLNTKIGISSTDSDLLKNIGEMCELFGIPAQEPQKYDFFVDSADLNLSIGNIPIKIILTPGHTQGGVSYLIGNTVFTGDTLFYGSYGRVDLPGGDFQAIKNSLKEVLFKLDSNTVAYPGHGDSTTIEFEKKYNEINN